MQNAAASRIASASRPLFATITACPRFSSRRLATSWFTRLSSTRRIRPAGARFAQRVTRDQWRPTRFRGLTHSAPARCASRSSERLIGLRQVARRRPAPGIGPRRPAGPAEVSITIRGPLRAGSRVIASARLKPSGRWHLDIGQHEIEWAARFLRRAHDRERFRHAAGQRPAPSATHEQHVLEHAGSWRCRRR